MKPLLVGESPCRGATGPAFSGRSGTVLECLAGFHPRDAFDCVNLLDQWPGHAGKGSAFPMPEARAAASMLLRVAPHRVVILAGRRVAAAFGLPGVEYLTWHSRCAVLIGVIPHPSGVNRWLNDPGNRRLLGEFLWGARTAANAA